MAENKRKIGEKYERRAGVYLAEQGYELLEYNFRCRMGEIDIIARDKGCLVFCEVKYRSGDGSGHLRFLYAKLDHAGLNAVIGIKAYD